MAEERSIEHYFSKEPKSRHRINRIECILRGNSYGFFTDSSVFSKDRIDLGTKILIKHMQIKPADIVLDLGCGYGAIGIVAASLAPNGRCYMTDINERAIELSKRNLKLNKIKNAEAFQGDGFEPVDSIMFDVILTNPPIRAGRNIVLSFIKGANSHLKKNGLLYLVVQTKQGAKTIKELIEEVFGNAEYASLKGGFRLIVAKKL